MISGEEDVCVRPSENRPVFHTAMGRKRVTGETGAFVPRVGMRQAKHLPGSPNLCSVGELCEDEDWGFGWNHKCAKCGHHEEGCQLQKPISNSTARESIELTTQNKVPILAAAVKDKTEFEKLLKDPRVIEYLADEIVQEVDVAHMIQPVIDTLKSDAMKSFKSNVQEQVQLLDKIKLHLEGSPKPVQEKKGKKIMPGPDLNDNTKTSFEIPKGDTNLESLLNEAMQIYLDTKKKRHQ